MASKGSKPKGGDLDGGVPVGPPQHFTTSGNIVHPVEGLSNDAGCGNPPQPGAYGARADGPGYPSAEKVGGGNAKAMSAYFGTKSPGGGK